jgi:hypothetical protein
MYSTYNNTVSWSLQFQIQNSLRSKNKPTKTKNKVPTLSYRWRLRRDRQRYFRKDWKWLIKWWGKRNKWENSYYPLHQSRWDGEEAQGSHQRKRKCEFVWNRKIEWKSSFLSRAIQESHRWPTGRIKGKGKDQWRWHQDNLLHFGSIKNWSCNE